MCHLDVAFDLAGMAVSLFRTGLRRVHPDLAEEDFHRLFLTRLGKCHNRDY
jgi:hypothetical protein